MESASYEPPRGEPRRPCVSPAAIWICGAELRRLCGSPAAIWLCEAEKGSGALALSEAAKGSGAFAPATGSWWNVLEAVAHHLFVRPPFANRLTSLSASGWVSGWTSWIGMNSVNGHCRVICHCRVIWTWTWNENAVSVWSSAQRQVSVRQHASTWKTSPASVAASVPGPASCSVAAPPTEDTAAAVSAALVPSSSAPAHHLRLVGFASHVPFLATKTKPHPQLGHDVLRHPSSSYVAIAHHRKDHCFRSFDVHVVLAVRRHAGMPMESPFRRVLACASIRRLLADATMVDTAGM